MTAAAIIADDHGWLIGEEAPPGQLTAAAHQQRATRIAAAMFQRRARLLFHWRAQEQQRYRSPPRRMAPPRRSAGVRRRADADAALAVTTNLPPQLPPLREEVAIWRSFLARDIDAILFGDA